MDSKTIAEQILAKLAEAEKKGEQYQQEENERDYPSRSAGMAYELGCLRSIVWELAHSVEFGGLVCGKPQFLPWWVEKGGE